MAQYQVEAFLKATGADEFSRSFDKASDSVSKIGNSTGKATGGLRSFMGGVGKIAGAIGVTKLVAMGFNAIKDSVGAAVTRVDTLNQFPKMMEAIGFSTLESEDAVSKLSDGIQGLPTRLDEVTGSAQQIAIMTGDLEGATDTTLALNNAFLASGSSSADAERGLTQYVQMLSKGEVDMQSWRTLQETMGVALNDTAEAFGFAGESAQNDLYAALQDGTITFDEFNDKIIELDEGVGGFAERALIGSEGIATSMQNIKTAIATGLANAIVSVDEAMEAGGFGSIAENLDGVKVRVQESFAAIVSMIGPTVEALGIFYNFISESTAVEGFITTLNSLGEVFQSVWIGIQEVFESIAAPLMDWWIENQQEVSEAITTVWNAIQETFDSVLNSISELVTSVFGSIATFIDDNQEAIKAVIDVVWNTIQDIFDIAVNFILPLVTTAFTLMSTVVGTAMDVILSVITVALAIITGDWEAAWNGIKSIIETVLGAIEDVVETVLLAVVSIFGTQMGYSEDEVDSGLATIKGFFDDLDLFESGKAIIQSALDGILWMKEKVFGGVETIVGGIRDLWPFSPAKEGPLKDINKMDFAGPIGDSIDNAKKPIHKSMAGLAGVAQDGLTTPTMDIAGNIARSNGQVKSAVSHEINNSRSKEPASISLRLGNRDYRAFVEDISSTQSQSISFEESYGL